MKPKYIFYDFDGVLTDNRVLLFESGQECVFANRSDGLAISLIRDLLKIPQAIISTEMSALSTVRGEKLGIPAFNGVKNKLQKCELICNEAGFLLSEVAFVGNDLNDLEVMKSVGFPLAPIDAHPDVRKLSYVELKKRGGFGVASEIYSLICEDISNVE